MRRCILGMALIAAALLPSCEKAKDEGDLVGADNINAAPNDAEQGTGCIQGVVMNGLTHQRVALGADLANMLYAVTPGRILPAQAIKSSGNGVTREHLEGEYYICGIPVENDFPLYVKMSGYQEFFASVDGISLNSQRAIPVPGAGATIEKFWSTPVRQLNIRVFPTAELVGDYKVTVLFRGTPVSGAQVRLVPTTVGGSPSTRPATGSDSSFATASDLRMQALAASTNSAGEATFAASNLVFGGNYTLYAYHPKLNAAEGRTVEGSLTRSGLVVGVAKGDPMSDPFAVQVSFAENSVSDLLKLIARSNQTMDTGSIVTTPDGSLALVFNRAVTKRAGSITTAFSAVVNSHGRKADGTLCGATFTVPAVNATFTAGSNTVLFTPTFSNPDAVAQAKAECNGIEITYTLTKDAIRAEGLPDVAWTDGVSNSFTVRMTDE